MKELSFHVTNIWTNYERPKSFKITTIFKIALKDNSLAFKPSQANVPFSYPLKTIGFLIFSGGIKK